MRRRVCGCASGRRVDLHRRPGTRVSARNGRRSAAHPRRRSESGPPHGARQAADAEGHQPFCAGAAARRRDLPSRSSSEVEELDAFVDLGDLEEESAAYTKRRNEVKQQLAEIVALHKKLGQLSDKLDAVPLSNKKLRRRVARQS